MDHVQRCPRAVAAEPTPIQMELVWGRDKRLISIPATGVTVGSTGEADVVIPAAFLAPVHVRIAPAGQTWTVECLAAAGQVLLRGKPVRHGTVGRGDVIRLADLLVAIGFFDKPYPGLDWEAGAYLALLASIVAAAPVVMPAIRS